MNRKILLTAAGLALATVTLLVACGGGSSSGSSASSSGAAGSTPTATTASGVLSSFGSVVVNGAEYAVANSTSVVDGDSDDATSGTASLQVGMRVDVDASSGTASLIRFTSAVRGEVDAVDTTASTLTVMGQTVNVTSATAFAGSKLSGSTSSAISGLSNVSVGDYVVVYGFEECTASTSSSSCTSGTTSVLATLVYEPATAGNYRVEGYAENVTSSSFTINGLTVDLTSSTVCSPSPCAIAAGEYLAARSSTAPVSVSGVLTLTATQVKATSQVPVLVAGATVSLEGPVANLDTSTNTFTLRGITIDGSALASTVASLSTGDIVDVTGTVNASVSITASAITVEKHATFAIMAPLGAASGSADTLTVLGQTFTVNASTHFVDWASNVRPFNMSNFATVLSMGNQLIVSGYSGTSGYIATSVQRIPTPTTSVVGVMGLVGADSSTADTLDIGGVTVDVSSATILRYPGSLAGATMAGFFSSITPNTSVVAVLGTAGSASGTVNAAVADVFSSNCAWAAYPR